MDNPSTSSVVEDFRRARFKADLQGVLARLTGHSGELLAYDEVRSKLRGVESAHQRRQEVPLADIVGSVGRYHDYNRLFLPLRDSDAERWVKVKQAMTGLSGVPPIEVYRVGDVYFVKDGNHRVSVARQLGLKTIDAYVTDVAISVPLRPDDTPDDLIIKAEQATFLERTELKRLRPEAEVSVTVPGQYDRLLEHIEVHRYFMGLEGQRDVGLAEAAAHWFDTVYLPVVALIQQRGLLQSFPERTATDIYLWLAEFQAELERDLGWQLSPAKVTLGVSESKQPGIRGALLKTQDPGSYLLESLLVAINGTEEGWRALEQAFEIARRERVKLYGLHVIARADTLEEAAQVQAEFERRCREAGVAGQFATEVGNVVATIGARARWADLVVASLSFPPGQAEFRLSSGFHLLLRRNPRPVLAVPGAVSPLRHALLAYDGSAKSDIALFAAAYAALRWGLRLSVVTVTEGGKAGPAALERARSYLEQHQVAADYLQRDGQVVGALLLAAAEQEADLLMLGSYRYARVLEPFLGGVLDELLRRSRVPMLICQ